MVGRVPDALRGEVGGEAAVRKDDLRLERLLSLPAAPLPCVGVPVLDDVVMMILRELVEERLL